jgi:hypothetical protein
MNKLSKWIKYRILRGRIKFQNYPLLNALTDLTDEEESLYKVCRQIAKNNDTVFLYSQSDEVIFLLLNDYVVKITTHRIHLYQLNQYHISVQVSEPILQEIRNLVFKNIDSKKNDLDKLLSIENSILLSSAMKHTIKH